MERTTLELALFRVSQINNCAFCLDMHAKDARAAGETEQRLYGISAWRETPWYSAREKAALHWAEAVTACDVTDNIYQAALQQFTGEELIDLTLAVTTTNTWNRINNAFPRQPGSYQAGMFG